MPESKDERLARLNRERVKRHREEKRKRLVPVEVWVKPSHKARLKAFVKDLNSRGE